MTGWKRFVFTLLAFAVGVAVAVNRVPLRPMVSAAGDGPLRTGEAGPLSIPNDRGPFPGNVPTSLSDAPSQVPFPVHRPNHPLASDTLITKLWVVLDETEPRLAIEYSTGVELRLEQEWIGSPPPGGKGPLGPDSEQSDDTPADFGTLVDRLAEQGAENTKYPLQVWIGSVNGLPAFTTPYQAGLNRGSVMFSLPDHVRVSVFGNLDKTSLLAIAETID